MLAAASFSRYDRFLTICHSLLNVGRRDSMLEPELLDSVAAAFPASGMDAVLAAVHRQGHGHHARLIHCDNGAFPAQLQRAGVPPEMQKAIAGCPDRCVLIIEAPRQTARVAELLLGLGALQVERFTGARPVSTLLSFDTSRLEQRGRRRSSRTP